MANLNIDLRVDIDGLLPIIDTAEYMGMVIVQQGDISLTDLGRKALGARMNERKKIIRDKIQSLEPFVHVTSFWNDRKELSRFELARFVNQKLG